MKKIISIIIFCLILGIAFSPVGLSAQAQTPLPDKQWEAPIMPGGTITKTEDTALFIIYDQPYDKVLTWYKEALKTYIDPKYPDVNWTKYRDWKDQMYIEDQGGAKWHSIGISKDGGDKTAVKIVKDNFTWIFSTLLIRFVGVFAVLCILWILLNINSFIMKRVFSDKPAAPKAE
jgi:hypothetical protein